MVLGIVALRPFTRQSGPTIGPRGRTRFAGAPLNLFVRYPMLNVASPPDALLAYRQEPVCRESRMWGLVEAFATVVGLTASALIVVRAWQTGGVPYLEGLAAATVVTLSVACLYLGSIAPRSCVHCGGMLNRVYHEERGHTGAIWHGFIFVCHHCKAYEGHLQADHLSRRIRFTNGA